VATAVNALLFDVGRVLIELDWSRAPARWAELAGIPVAQIERLITDRVLASDTFCRHERGQVADAILFAELGRALKVELTDAEWLDGWNSIFVGEMPGIRRVLARVQGKLPLYVFSNTNAAHHAHWSSRFCDLLAPFGKIYVSHDLGLRKPEPAAFRAVVADMGVAAENVLFFDDLPQNVAAARGCGLIAKQVASASDIEDALTGLGFDR
jgi:putative hydrolase of the HAD superfamily